VRGRDAVDSARITAHVVDEVMLVEDETMAGGDNGNQGVYVESLMHGENIEFSDIDEPLLERPRTRSQSRAKEPSQPPMEIEQVDKKKVSRKQRLPKAGPKRRRAIVQEQTLTDDEEF
jgi:hypothetical protein